MSWRQFVPFAFVSTIFFLSLLSIFSTVGRLALIFVLGLYLLANLAATSKSATRIKPIGLPFVFIGFPILHLSYGLGFIAGLIAFWRRWREKKTEIVGNQTLSNAETRTK
jgi:succinoglycan biosynthesis protein ExoA